jgi:hypothetical protein
MHRQRNWILLLVTSLLLFSSLACSVGRFLPASRAHLPERSVPVNPEAAAEAEAIIRQAGSSETVRLTESQFTSFLMERLNQQDGEGVRVEDMTVWFEPDRIHLRVRTSEAVVPGSDTVAMSGQLLASEGRIALRIDEASVGAINLPSSVLTMLNDQVDKALAQSQINNIPVRSIRTEQGAITIERMP